MMEAMLKSLASALLISTLLVSANATDNEFPRCNCEDEGFWGNIENIMECQKVSDFLIAVAYFSIPIELLYFVSCSNFPFKFKGVLFLFIAFIVLCGMTHLLNGLTYGPHPHQLMQALTIFKFLTALVSFATAITLIKLIPLLLKSKVREIMLKKKTWDLGREMGMIKKQKETGWHVRMLTQEIRKSLDRHTILYTTLEKLSETLDLQNCAIWMPNEDKTEMNLTHELKGVNNPSRKSNNISMPIMDLNVQAIKASEEVKILDPDSQLAFSSSGGDDEPGPVAAIRMPMLRFSNFKGGTPEMMQMCYTILVLVLPGGQDRIWTNLELDIVKVVADQVAVALSHAAVLEESQLMRDKLVEQNRALQQAKQNALMASQARNSFQMVMSNGMKKPMYSVMGLLSFMQNDNLCSQQQVLVDAMVKTSNVLSMLINDVMDSSKDNGRFPLEMRSFSLHSFVKEAACFAKCLSAYNGYSFVIEVEKSMPDCVMGDERRIFQVILHMVGNLLKGRSGGGSLTLRVFSESGSHGRNDQRWGTWRTNSSDGYVFIKFEVGISNNSLSLLEGSFVDWRQGSEGVEHELSFNICRKIVQMMQGSIWVVPNPVGFDQSMALVLRFQLRPSTVISIPENGESLEHPQSNSLFRGLQVLLADSDDLNRSVTRKQLERLGCFVSAVSSCSDCLNSLTQSFQILILDLQMPGLDGFEVTSRIRMSRSRNWPLVIGLTASDDGDVWEKCVQMGMNGVIQKPVLLQGVANELRRVLLQANEIV